MAEQSYEPNLFGEKTKQETVTLWSRCYKKLSATTRSKEKEAERTRLLQERPNERVRIETSKLRQIVDYESFKCHPQCSIARDEAIRGSDIDGALVVLKAEISIDQQLAFVQELRNQGFFVSHLREIETAIKEIENVRAGGLKTDLEKANHLQLLIKKDKLDSSQIKFFTKSQLEDMKSNSLTLPLMIYVAGYSIESKQSNNRYPFPLEVGTKN